ncbi:MAG TPA: dimethyl sulfoxide reductase anchor subunit [Sulfurovum sp.]|jgi:Fe-S-cluster-containing dehydrogenase component/DMSO reductase anchor subunit|nr:MAG: molybdopterin oxidoreductase [Sulfurovum sp. 35-42-20]OYY57310.1 MAG: molybdopterin oxidoreductase [Sulfurovum sp. 28-43-6]OYZ25729.1 MAG: molybdopterin oxidoreductase [Sulfurovum sp. 16-42-52]OYZ50283.1 MAG: molybdopterin oxidoreductase [Sulfurovum sp. 24-42-9]OZA45108.1 MAG: molybdopterin oxidoreductase [Sulfurovum sp. 17-42-90]OZA60360.1 MAG: molybdopterin oxidoreductase [Sulfurovum sp. 39-42-12]HQR73334.1 dimethyl sulfoxide reductase anchor subunit [Sulfurovum sp.]
MAVQALSEHTPLADFINHKTNTGMQCGNYSIDLPVLNEGEQYRFHFDATACVGCHCCEVACNEQNANPDEIKWRRVGEMEMGAFPDTLQLFNSMSCNHCIEPACLIGCPTESYVKFDNGIVWHDDPSCIGCQYCTWNCPYEVPTFNADRGIVTKCHMCADKLELGQSPACVQACPSNAIEIEVFNVKQWLEEDMSKEGVAPHLPDVAITKPTTRYTLPKLKEGETLRVADEHLLKPAHAELPLVFMTVLTQVSLGAFLALFLGELLFALGFNLPQPNLTMALLAFIPTAIGLPLSALHLGRPIMALKAMKNWRTSWLSREAIALGAFTGLVSMVALLYYLQKTGVGLLLLEAVTLAVGIYGIYAQSMIYRIKARPSWDRSSTNKKFFGTGYVGFLLITSVLLAYNGTQGAMVLLAITLLAGMAQTFVIFEEMMFYQNLDKEDPLYYQYNRSRILLQEHFTTVKKLRVYSLAIFALALPLLALLFTASGLVGWAMISVLLATLGAFVSELSGRYLFYRTVVPLGLAGNFFAGNQRH